VAAVEDWAPAPARPALDDEEVAVWRLSSAAPQPIETVLARYLAVEPSSLTLGRTPAGKPELAGAPFRVSLAHGGGVALVAVTEGRDAGVDVEPVRPDSDRWTLVDHALTPDERLQLERVPPARRANAFLSMWTRKEALLKAAGVGLAVDPGLVELDGVSVRAVPPALGSALDWTIVDVPLADHLAALAVRGFVSRLRLYVVS
jgi:4'-phosphopantetheinyl transferase